MKYGTGYYYTQGLFVNSRKRSGFAWNITNSQVMILLLVCAKQCKLHDVMGIKYLYAYGILYFCLVLYSFTSQSVVRSRSTFFKTVFFITSSVICITKLHQCSVSPNHKNILHQNILQNLLVWMGVLWNRAYFCSSLLPSICLPPIP